MSLENFFKPKTQDIQKKQEVADLPRMNILPFLTKERRADILEIVDFCALCIEKYFKEFNIPPIPKDRFFLFSKESVDVFNKDSLGLYLSDVHAFGIREDALYAPHILIHEMVHFISSERAMHTGTIGYQFKDTRENLEENTSHTFYIALNEGMTDLIAQEIYSLFYKDLKHFFSGRGGMEPLPSNYSEPIIFVQKLVAYNALLLKMTHTIPDEEAHRQIWHELKQGYLENNHQYLEDLFTVFGDSLEKKEVTVSFIQSLEPKKEHVAGFNTLIKALDNKIANTPKKYTGR